MLWLRAVFILAMMFLGAPASAQGGPATKSPPLLMLQQQAPSHPERVLLAFYKIAGLEPDFLRWAENSPFLDDAKDSDRDSIVSRENNRMRRAYSEFDVNDPLIVHTKIHLDDYSTLQETLTLSEFTPKTFFSFSLYGENAAVVPKDIAAFSKIAIGKAEMDDILKKAGGGQVEAELLLKPVVADAKAPFVQRGTSYWLLLAEIGEIRFWSMNSNTPELLWMHRADWFKPKQDDSLMDLKSGTDLQ